MFRPTSTAGPRGREKFGEVNDANPAAAAAQSGPELAQAAGIDRDQVVHPGRLHRIQLRRKDPGAVTGTQQRIGAGRPAAGVVPGHRHELGHRRDQRPRLLVYPEAVAQMARILQCHPGPPAVHTQLALPGSLRS